MQIIISLILIIIAIIIYQKFYQGKSKVGRIEHKKQIEDPEEIKLGIEVDRIRKNQILKFEDFNYKIYEMLEEGINNKVVEFNLNITSLISMNLPPYVIFYVLSNDQDFDFYEKNERYGFGTSYGDWENYEKKAITGTINIPEENFSTLNDTMYLNIFYNNIKFRKIAVVQKFIIQGLS